MIFDDVDVMGMIILGMLGWNHGAVLSITANAYRQAYFDSTDQVP